MKRLMILLAGFAISLIFDSSGFTNELSGHVTDRAKASIIAGAKVQPWKEGQVTDYSTATDFEGNFSIVNISPGFYDVVVFHPSYVKKEIKNIKITDGIGTGFTYGHLAMEPIQTGPPDSITNREMKKVLSVNRTDTSSGPFPLPSGFYPGSRQNNSRGQVRGQVIEKKTKEPIFGSRVRLLLPDGTSAKMRAISDDKGNFLILNVPPGNYQIEVSYGTTYTKKVIKNVKVEAGRIFETGIIDLEEKAVEGDTIILRNHPGFIRK